MIPTIPRIYTALAEWLGCIIYVLIKRKKIDSKFFLISSIFLAAQVAWQIFSGIFPIWMWIPSMIIAFTLMFLHVSLSCNTKFFESGFYTIRAFVTAEFSASIEWQLYSFLKGSYSVFSSKVIECFFVLLVFGLIFFFCFIVEKEQIKESDIKISAKDFISSMVIGIAIFSVSNLNFATQIENETPKYLNKIYYIRTLVDFCGLFILFSQRQAKRWMQAKFDMNIMQSVIQKQYDQYCQSKDNIELLNQKFHDLKHQIYLIRAEKNFDRIDTFLTEMEHGLKQYEAENKTGNAVLDVLLTSKSLVCEKEDINFTSVVDGKLLDFLEVTDLCTIFGNAMDNAIESVHKIADIEKRIIKLSVFSKEGLKMIKFSNYYEGEINFKNDEFITTKKDKSLHGYGLKSIRHCAEKYGGIVNINYENNWFNLFILFV